MTPSISKIAVVALFAAVVSGCSGLPDVEDVVDFSTPAAPDEREVRVHQVLTMPPDYQLRAPQQGGPASGQANPYALPTLQQGGALPQNQLATAPGTPAPLPAPGTQPVATAPVVGPAQVASAPGPATIAPGTQPAQGQQPAQQPGGVNPYHPDGTPKTANEMNEEMRQRRIDEERRSNPGYGTIWNIGSLWE